MTDWRIPLSDVDLDAHEEAAVLRVIRSGWLTAGAEVGAFEREFADFLCVDAALGVSSCTAALHLACLALGVDGESEVIVPALTFVATANAVAVAGGRVVFADSVSLEDLTLDPADVERRITPATKGIICMHYGGHPCQMERLLDIVRHHGLFLIEDAAHAPGGRWRERRLGTLGDVGCFSFFGNKNMTMGEGGVAVARDASVHERMRSLRSHGMTTSSWDRFQGHAYDYDVLEAGFNYRLAELPAAVGREQLKKLEANNARRTALLARYHDRLKHADGVVVPFCGQTDTAHLSVVLLPDAERRDAVRAALRDAGIQTSLHYPPAHLFDEYRTTAGYAPGDLPVCEAAASRLVTLPLYATMTPEQVDEICQLVLDAA
jgi:dTDP-4-amino-4,6-dideoxygalactose transaminase